MRGIIRQETEI